MVITVEQLAAQRRLNPTTFKSFALQSGVMNDDGTISGWHVNDLVSSFRDYEQASITIEKRGF
jgi:hypothetical protein